MQSVLEGLIFRGFQRLTEDDYQERQYWKGNSEGLWQLVRGRWQADAAYGRLEATIGAIACLLGRMEEEGEFDPPKRLSHPYGAALEDLAFELRVLLSLEPEVWERLDPACKRALEKLEV